MRTYAREFIYKSVVTAGCIYHRLKVDASFVFSSENYIGRLFVKP